MPQDKDNPLKKKSFKFIMVGMILLAIACVRWLTTPHEVIYNAFETILAIGIAGFGFKLSKDEKNK